MKILHLSNVIGEKKGGGVHEVVSNLYKYQKNLSHEPHIWYPGSNEDADSIRVDENIKCLPTFGNSNYGFIKGIFHSIPASIEQFDIMHQHGIWMPMSLYSHKIRRKSNLKAVIQPHGYLLPYSLSLSKYKKQLAFGLFEKSNLRAATILVACANEEAIRLKEIFPNKDVAIIPNGVSKEFLNAKPSKKSYSNSKKRMLFLSQIIPVKGLERVFRGMNAIGINKFSNWEFIIAGYENLNYRAFLNKTIKQLNLNKIVRFVGPKFGQDKLDLVDNSAVFILPSFNENYGIVVAEVLARGVPVLTTKGTPWEELETHNCGFWVDNSDEGIKSGLQKLLKIPEKELKAMGKRGKELVECKYLWNEQALKTIELYHWVIRGGSKPNFII